jgi:hypothetical protein
VTRLQAPAASRLWRRVSAAARTARKAGNGAVFHPASGPISPTRQMDVGPSDSPDDPSAIEGTWTDIERHARYIYWLETATPSEHDLAEAVLVLLRLRRLAVYEEWDQQALGFEHWYKRFGRWFLARPQ